MKVIMKTCGIYLVLATSQVLGLIDYTCPNTATSKALQEFCARTLIDDMIMDPVTKNIYTFKGDQVILQPSIWSAIASGYPKPAKDLWPNIPANIDAAFIYSVTKKTYFLKGSQFWRYTNFTLDEGFPMPISEGFGDVPDNVDAAVEWGGYIYFFKGKTNYRYNPCLNETFTIPIRDFAGLPDTKLDAVLKYLDSYVYFFIGDLYFTFTLSTMKVTPANPSPSGYHWFDCRWQ